MKVRPLAQAEDEAQEAALFYDVRSPGLGFEFLDAFIEALGAIGENPQRFARVETLRTRREIRSYPLSKFPFNVIYEVQREQVLVLAVAHARRRPNYWKNRR